MCDACDVHDMCDVYDVVNLVYDGSLWRLPSPFCTEVKDVCPCLFCVVHRDLSHSTPYHLPTTGHLRAELPGKFAVLHMEGDLPLRCLQKDTSFVLVPQTCDITCVPIPVLSCVPSSLMQ